MARYRLRFLLQEFDLLGPEVILGRSPECHITIEDPLVSRRHARIKLGNDHAVVEDLGSRNGVRVNGKRIESPNPLDNGDRIRIGTQELVFFIAGAREKSSRTTGFMRLCRACGVPYPEGISCCPHCGADDAEEDTTISGLVVEPQRSWTFRLLGEVIDRALGAGRPDEAERVLRRAAEEMDERMSAGERLDPEQVATITGYALRLAAIRRDAEWLSWALTVHRGQQMVPSEQVLTHLEQLDSSTVPSLASLVEQFAVWMRSVPGMDGPDDVVLDRLERLTTRGSAGE